MSSTIAYFVTAHGFGHASRAAAVMEALGGRDPSLAFEIFTTVPDWFFAQSLSVPHHLRPVVTDVGLVQLDPFRADLEATVEALRGFWSGLRAEAERLAKTLARARPRLVISDISPLGLEVASRLGVPSVLVENFTWDWIYSAYEDAAPGLAEFAERSARSAATATLHLQCEPACRPSASAVRVRPVSRSPRSDRSATRRALGLEESDARPMVLLTLGGMGWGSGAPDLDTECVLVALGGVDRGRRRGSVVHLPNRSPIYPPDLVWAADAVVGKLGYSTVAECCRAGARLGYLTRPGFPESPVLEQFAQRELPALEIDPDSLDGALNGETLERLLELPRGIERQENGADDIARRVMALAS